MMPALGLLSDFLSKSLYVPIATHSRLFAFIINPHS